MHKRFGKDHACGSRHILAKNRHTDTHTETYSSQYLHNLTWWSNNTLCGRSRAGAVRAVAVRTAVNSSAQSRPKNVVNLGQLWGRSLMYKRISSGDNELVRQWCLTYLYQSISLTTLLFTHLPLRLQLRVVTFQQLQFLPASHRWTQ